MTEVQESLIVFQEAFRPVLSHCAQTLSIGSFTGAAAAYAVWACACAQPPTGFVLAITPGLGEADALLGDVLALNHAGSFDVLDMPPLLEDEDLAEAARLRVVRCLHARRTRPLILIAPRASWDVALPSTQAVQEATVQLSPASSLSYAEIQTRLRQAGYTRAQEVTVRGTYAVRGGVLDVWSPPDEKPIRAEFFGDTLERLGTFDAALQTSLEAREEATFEPVHVVAAATQTLAELLPEQGVVLWLNHPSYAVPSFERAQVRQIFTGDPAPAHTVTWPFLTAPLPGFAELGISAARDPALLDAARAHLHKHVAMAQAQGALVVEAPNLSGGFEIVSRTDSSRGLVVVTKSDRVFSHRRLVRHTRSSTGARLLEEFDLEPGEYVVHLDYGIGKFLGTTEIELAGARREVFALEYADGALLHVPTSHAHLLSRYVGVKGEEVHVHALDGVRWEKEKKAAQKAVEDLAASLLETQARRAVVPGFAYDVRRPEMVPFEEAFPYEETPDQAQAIADVKHDMALTKPMDRLICGDAGYGKTEVAMRAAFIAAINGRQVAVLAPTTVLAEQHYETFLARFDGTPIRIEALSRFQSAQVKKLTRAHIFSGATDIVIGTHAILSKHVLFHDLGLIIIDEEQRFGVKQKEHLKSLRTTADVLTMSATPIPRTLYLSMTGTRELSLLRTPPSERVATETTISRANATLIERAIRREHARGGQVFFVHNRVATIDKLAQELHALIPELRLDVAHGQLPANVLAEKMQAFQKGETDVLVCTTIVESGLDITNANTILVDRADCYGLAELYQLRGRVGRGAQQGFAYFLLPEEGTIEGEARARLEALRKHAGLGAGFNISLRDLEIRGAGNLLGCQQSGHIAAIGFQLYCQLLRRTVSRLKGEPTPGLIDVTVNVDFVNFSPSAQGQDPTAACIPYAYIEDEAQRLLVHKRLAEISTSQALKAFRVELADRFGQLPLTTERLLKLAEFRLTLARAGISRVDVRGTRAFFHRQGAQEVSFVGKVEGSTPEQKLASLVRTLLTQKETPHVPGDKP